MQVLTPQDLTTAAQSCRPSVWLVAGLLRTNRKRISLICGSPHAGKSTLARQLAIAVAQGKPFLGRDTVKAKVAYWQSEETTEDAAEDFARSGMKDDDNLVILHPAPEDNNLEELDKLLTTDPDIKLVIIETLDDFLRMDDLDDNPSARRAFEKFDKDVVSKHQEVCFVALHHFKKSDEQRGMSLNRILGATVIAGKSDAKVYLRQSGETDQRRYISVQIRKGTSLEATYLDFDEATQSSVLGVTLAEERDEAKKISTAATKSDLRQRCIEAVTRYPGESQRSICERVGGKTKTTNDMLNQLRNDGVITCQLGGPTNSTHMLYIKGAEPIAPTPPVPSAPKSLDVKLRDAVVRLEVAKNDKEKYIRAGYADGQHEWQRTSFKKQEQEVIDAQAEVDAIEAQIGVTVQ